MFDQRTLTRLEKVVDLQMWAFGCDARCPDGSLFAARGMQRTPPPAGSALSSTWSETWNGAVVELSTLGIRLRRGAEEVLLERGPLGPQLQHAPRELVALAARWVLDWEAWVDARRGAGWRDETLRARRRPAPFDSAALRDEWSGLAAT